MIYSLPNQITLLHFPTIIKGKPFNTRSQTERTPMVEPPKKLIYFFYTLIISPDLYDECTGCDKSMNFSKYL